MCQFKSALIENKTEIRHLWWTDSHEIMADVFGLRPRNAHHLSLVDLEKLLETVMPIEFMVSRDALGRLTDGDVFDPDRYELVIDTGCPLPKWADVEWGEKIVDRMAKLIEPAFVRGKRGVLAEGPYLLCEGSQMSRIWHGRIVAVHPSVDLTAANMEGVNMERAFLNDVRMPKVHAWRGDFHNANMLGACLEGAYVMGGVFDGAKMCKADLRGLMAQGSSFFRADLEGVNLAGADLTGCEFMSANLRGVDMSGVILHRTSFREADLRGVKGLDGAALAMLGAQDLRNAKWDGPALAGWSQGAGEGCEGEGNYVCLRPRVEN